MSKVSIIIPVYNAEKFLNKCLDSVIEQTYKNIEVICVNDGSKDRSLEVLKEYQKKDERIVIIDKENAGVSEARNDGIRKSTGEYITFVDSDDWLEKDAIESMYNALIEKDVDVVRSNYCRNKNYEKNDITGDMCGLENKVIDTNWEDFVEIVLNKLLSGKVHCFVVLLMAKRDCVMKTSLFRSEIIMMEDVIFYNELFASVKNIYFLDKVTYHYYDNQKSCTRAPEYYKRNAENLLKVYEIICENINKDRYKEANRIEIFTAHVSNIIAGYIFSLYMELGKTKKELIDFIEDLLQSEKIKKLLKKTNLKLLPKHLAMPIMLLEKRKYKTLFVFYDLRIFMRTLKNRS